MQIRTLCAAATLLAAPSAVMAQAYLDNTTIGNIASVQVGTSANTHSTYLDVEGTGNGSFATFALVDFGTLYYAPNQALLGNTIDLNLTDSPFSHTAPGLIDVYLVTTPVSNPSALTYQTSASGPLGVNGQFSTIAVGPTASSYAYPNSLNYNPLSSDGSYPSTPATGSGGNYNYTLTLDPVALDYFNTVLNDPNGDLQLVIAADASTPNIVGSFLGGTAANSATSPLIGFNSVPEPGAAPLLISIGTVGLLAIRRRKR